jgi:hypothetical protein
LIQSSHYDLALHTSNLQVAFQTKDTFFSCSAAWFTQALSDIDMRQYACCHMADNPIMGPMLLYGFFVPPAAAVQMIPAAI